MAAVGLLDPGTPRLRTSVQAEWAWPAPERHAQECQVPFECTFFGLLAGLCPSKFFFCALYSSFFPIHIFSPLSLLPCMLFVYLSFSMYRSFALYRQYWVRCRLVYEQNLHSGPLLELDLLDESLHCRRKTFPLFKAGRVSVPSPVPHQAFQHLPAARPSF